MIQACMLHHFIQSRVFKRKNTADTQVETELNNFLRLQQVTGKAMEYSFQLSILVFFYNGNTFIDRIP